MYLQTNYLIKYLCKSAKVTLFFKKPRHACVRACIQILICTVTLALSIIKVYKKFIISKLETNNICYFSDILVTYFT